LSFFDSELCAENGKLASALLEWSVSARRVDPISVRGTINPVSDDQ
jgi:hypothetical protein